MKTLTMAILTVMYVTGCVAQSGDKKIPNPDSKQSELQNTPKESWNVKKEKDENGNVTRYDSTYTWSYSSSSGDSVDVDVDSVLQSFDLYFNQQFPSLWGPRFMNPMHNDSALHPDFFRGDYFQNQWKKDMYDMNQLFRQMDSMRNKFFDETYPGMMTPQDTKKETEFIY